MLGLFILVGVLLLPLPSVAAEHVLAWTYLSQPQDQDFVVERCRNRRQGCVMQRLVTVGLALRTYTDRAVSPQQAYCYQVGVRDAQRVYQWSNSVCSG